MSDIKPLEVWLRPQIERSLQGAYRSLHDQDWRAVRTGLEQASSLLDMAKRHEVEVKAVDLVDCGNCDLRDHPYLLGVKSEDVIKWIRKEMHILRAPYCSR